MRRLLRSVPLAAVAVAALSGSGCGKVAVDIQVPKETIVQKVNRQFPLEKHDGPIALELSNPEVEFKTAENRLGVSADVQATMQGAPPARGHMEFDGTLEFQTDAFVFTDVKMNQFDLAGLPGDDAGQLKSLMRQALLREVKGMAVYKIHADDPKEAMVAQALSGVRVTDDGLVITLGGKN